MFSSGSELSTAIIDFITSVVLIIIVLKVSKIDGDNKIKNKWIHLLITLGICNFIGSIIHMFNFNEITKDIIWIFLYPFMYNISFTLLVFGINKYTNFLKPEKIQITILTIITIIMCIVSSINSFYVVKDIRIYAIFTAIIGFPGLLLLVTDSIKRNVNTIYYFIGVILTQVIGLLFIVKRSFNYKGFVELDYNTVYHLFLFVCVILLYFIARSDIENDRMDEIVENKAKNA